MHDIINVTTEFKFRPKYVCFVCGAEEYGQVVTAKFQVGLTETPAEVFKSWPLTVRHAPFGWAGFLGKSKDDFKCPECVKKNFQGGVGYRTRRRDSGARKHVGA